MGYPNPNETVSLNGIRFDSTIPHGAKILFAEFKQWAKKSGEFPYDAKTLAEVFGVTTFTIRKWINILAEHELIDMHVDLTHGGQQKMIRVCSERKNA